MDIEDVRRIEFRPGDRLVLRVKGRLSAEMFERIKRILEAFAPGVPVLVLDDGMSLDVLSGEAA
ncbi:hypothetical protein [Rhizobium sp. SYY.PMSO]|uniref:hypothetical protein n=1 Tax=Rhizobium sp. SYY.PMSO TaxID=3382192 RepID=UPI00398FE70F